jgi:hypothetical protein
MVERYGKQAFEEIVNEKLLASEIRKTILLLQTRKSKQRLISLLANMVAKRLSKMPWLNLA